MKPIHALVACALLGQLWLSACGSSSKKTPPRPVSDAGAAGEMDAPAGGRGGQPAEGGASGAPQPSEGGTAGDSAAAGAAMNGEGGEGGEGGAPACFTIEAGSDPSTGLYVPEGGTEGQILFRCTWLRDNLSPSYDPATNRVTFDASKLGPVAGGKYTAIYPLFDGETSTQHCVEGQAEQSGGIVGLPLPRGAQSIAIGAISVQDRCGGDVALDLEGQNGTCFQMQFVPTQDPTVWQIDCYEGFQDCAPATCDGFGQST